jgi:hypothetical protein
MELILAGFGLMVMLVGGALIALGGLATLVYAAAVLEWFGNGGG